MRAAQLAVAEQDADDVEHIVFGADCCPDPLQVRGLDGLGAWDVIDGLEARLAVVRSPLLDATRIVSADPCPFRGSKLDMIEKAVGAKADRRGD